MIKRDKRKNWYALSNVFIHIVRFSDKTLTLWTTRKHGGTKYQLMIWKDESGVCFKSGKEYGLGSCWETILPKQNTEIIQLKNKYNINMQKNNNNMKNTVKNNNKST